MSTFCVLLTKKALVPSSLKSVHLDNTVNIKPLIVNLNLHYLLTGLQIFRKGIWPVDIWSMSNFFVSLGVYEYVIGCSCE